MPFERHKLQFIFEYLMPRRVQLEPWGDEQVVAGWTEMLSFSDLSDRHAQLRQVYSRALGREDTCIPSSRACTWVTSDLPHRASGAQREGAVSDRDRSSVCRSRFALQRSWLAAACRWQSWVIRPTGRCSRRCKSMDKRRCRLSVEWTTYSSKLT